MSELVIKWDDDAPPFQVFLNGHLQTHTVSVNLTKGSLVRPFLGEPGPDQMKTDGGYVFDLVENDFVLETVYGDVTISWIDKDLGKAWMEKHGDA